MKQETCKNVIIPESNKIPKYPFCSESGVSLKPDGNGSFICPSDCRLVQEILRTGGQVVGEKNDSELPD